MNRTIPDRVSTGEAAADADHCLVVQPRVFVGCKRLLGCYLAVAFTAL
jgi:hypothetical protein